MSFIKILNNNSPSTEPCETPLCNYTKNCMRNRCLYVVLDLLGNFPFSMTFLYLDHKLLISQTEDHEVSNRKSLMDPSIGRQNQIYLIHSTKIIIAKIERTG